MITDEVKFKLGEISANQKSQSEILNRVEGKVQNIENDLSYHIRRADISEEHVKGLGERMLENDTKVGDLQGAYVRWQNIASFCAKITACVSALAIFLVELYRAWR